MLRTEGFKILRLLRRPKLMSRFRGPMPTQSNDDPIHQLEDDLKRLGANPERFPRTIKLVAAGAPQQAKKMVEEAAELAIEAVRSDRPAAVREAADLLYNIVVLLEGMNIPFDEVCNEMERRRALYGIAARQQKNGIGTAESA